MGGADKLARFCVITRIRAKASKLSLLGFPYSEPGQDGNVAALRYNRSAQEITEWSNGYGVFCLLCLNRTSVPPFISLSFSKKERSASHPKEKAFTKSLGL